MEIKPSSQPNHPHPTMLKKLASLALGLLTVIAIAPASQAATNFHPLSIQKPAGDLHSQVIIKLGGKQEYRQRGEAARRRELERQREAARRRQHHGNNRGEYHRDR
jgi:hypothetical protein